MLRLISIIWDQAEVMKNLRIKNVCLLSFVKNEDVMLLTSTGGAYIQYIMVLRENKKAECKPWKSRKATCTNNFSLEWVGSGKLFLWLFLVPDQ